MPMPLEALEAEVLRLDAAERARLLERLIASFEDDPGLKEAWEHEAIRRDLELENGEINPESGEQGSLVFAPDFGDLFASSSC